MSCGTSIPIWQTKKTTHLAVDVAALVYVLQRHGLHPNGRVQEREIFRHVVDRLLAQRTGVVARGGVGCEATQVHDVAALETTQGLGGLKHRLMADRAVALQRLRDADVLFVHTYTGVAPHAMLEVDSEASSLATHVAKWTVVD